MKAAFSRASAHVGEGVFLRHDAALGGSVQDMLPFAKAVYAPASMTELKVSVTASTGMPARHPSRADR